MYVRTLRRTDTSTIARVIGILLFAVATALSARLSALIPGSPVPLTLQVLTVVLSGFVLGARDAAIAQVLYLQAILMGAPLTAAGLGGPAAFVAPTAGYLLSFPLAAAVAGALQRTGVKGTAWRLLGGLAALTVIYAFGTLWLAAYVGNVRSAIALGVVPFVVPDVLKVVIASAVLSVRRG